MLSTSFENSKRNQIGFYLVFLGFSRVAKLLLSLFVHFFFSFSCLDTSLALNIRLLYFFGSLIELNNPFRFCKLMLYFFLLQSFFRSINSKHWVVFLHGSVNIAIIWHILSEIYHLGFEKGP